MARRSNAVAEKNLPEVDTELETKELTALEEVKEALNPAIKALQASLAEHGIDFTGDESLEALVTLLSHKASQLSDKKSTQRETMFQNYGKRGIITSERLRRNCFDWGVDEKFLNTQFKKIQGHETPFNVLSDMDETLSKDQLLQKIRASGVTAFDTSKSIITAQGRYLNKNQTLNNTY